MSDTLRQAKRCNRIVGMDGDGNYIRCGLGEATKRHDPLRTNGHVFDPTPVCDEDEPARYENGRYHA